MTYLINKCPNSGKVTGKGGTTGKPPKGVIPTPYPDEPTDKHLSRK